MDNVPDELRREFLKNQRESNRGIGRKVGRFIAGAIAGAALAGTVGGIAAPTNEIAIFMGIAGALVGGFLATRESEQRFAETGEMTKKQKQVANQMRQQADAAARGERLPATNQQEKALKKTRAEWARLQRKLEE